MRRGGRERTDDPRERSTEEGAVRARRRVTTRPRASVDSRMETSHASENENNFFTSLTDCSPVMQILGFLVIVITSFKPSSDRHHPQLPSIVRHQVSSFFSSAAPFHSGTTYGTRTRTGESHVFIFVTLSEPSPVCSTSLGFEFDISLTVSRCGC